MKEFKAVLTCPKFRKSSFELKNCSTFLASDAENSETPFRNYPKSKFLFQRH